MLALLRLPFCWGRTARHAWIGDSIPIFRATAPHSARAVQEIGILSPALPTDLAVQDLAEAFPLRAGEAHQLHLLDGEEVGGAGIELDAG